MILLTILFFMTVYVILALLFVSYVRKKTEIKFYRWLAVAFVILLPTWDVVLGYLVYYPACMFIPKVAIYETAVTEGIYYEGVNDEVYKSELNYNNKIEEVDQVGGLHFMFGKEGYKYLESIVTKRSNCVRYCEPKKIEPKIFRCIPLSKERSNLIQSICSEVEKAKSNYIIKVSTMKVGVVEINLKKIYDRKTGKLIAEYDRVARWGYSPPIPFIPFFNWLYRLDGSGYGEEQCPSPHKYEHFEYEVLKPKK